MIIHTRRSAFPPRAEHCNREMDKGPKNPISSSFQVRKGLLSRSEKKSRIFLFLELAVGTGVEDSLPFIGWSHLPGVVCHSLVPTSRAAPVNHRSLELRSFLHRQRHGCPQFVKHNWGFHNLPLKVSHIDGEATAGTGDRILSPGQRQDRAAIWTEIQVRLKAGADAGEVHDGGWSRTGKERRLLTNESSSLPTEGSFLFCPWT